MLAGFLALSLGAMAGGDAFDDAVRTIIADVGRGVDFSTGAFKDGVSKEDAATLAAMKPCTAGAVTRPGGGDMAILQWECPAETKLGHPLAMVALQGGKITISVAAPGEPH
jgi:hypothetical protein